MSYNGNYTPLVSVRHQFNSGLWLLICPRGGTVDTPDLGSGAERCESSSLSEGTNAGVSRCGNGVRLISGLVYPFAGSSPATGTKISQDGEMVNAQSSNLCSERFVGSSPTLGTNYTSFGPI